MCKFYAYNKKCKNKKIYGICPMHHDDDIKEMRRLTKSGTDSDMEDYAAILSQFEDDKLASRLLKFYPAKPSKSEIESEERAISNF